jgi:hypothetical protein
VFRHFQHQGGQRTLGCQRFNHVAVNALVIRRIVLLAEQNRFSREQLVQLLDEICAGRVAVLMGSGTPEQAEGRAQRPESADEHAGPVIDGG